MTIGETSRKWLAAGRILATTPTETVPCPSCDVGTLVVHDEVFSADPSMMERYLTCSTCGARNIIRMRVPS